MRVEASLIHVRATACTLGDIATLRLRGRQQLIGELGMTFWSSPTISSASARNSIDR